MARIQQKPITFTAYQFLGSPSALPLEFAAAITQQFVGEKAYLASSVLNAEIMSDGALVPYAAADLVNIGDWIIKGLLGFYRVGPGEFEMLFDVIEEDNDGSVDGRWLVTYVGNGPDDHVNPLRWLGYSFPYMRAIGIDNAQHAKQIMGHPHFQIEDTLNDGDGGTAGSESAAQVGRGDRGGSICAERHGDLHSGATSDAGLAGIEHTDSGSLSAYPASKHRSARPGSAATSSGRA